MGLLSGLISAGRALLGGAGTAVARTGALLPQVGRLITSPFGQAAIGTGVGLGAASLLTGGGPSTIGTAASPAGQAILAIQAAGGQVIQQLTGGRVLAMAPDGSVATFTRDGKIVRPSRIIPAGEPLPAGARVVSISPDRTRIGITLRRRRRAFSTEIRRVRNTIRGCRAVLSAAEKPKRRSSHG